MSRLFAMDKGSVENISFLQPAVGNFDGVTAVDTLTNPNSIKPADATGTDNPDNSDTYSNAPMADAPPSARSSNGHATKHAH
jgi:hypothetical protein